MTEFGLIPLTRAVATEFHCIHSLSFESGAHDRIRSRPIGHLCCEATSPVLFTSNLRQQSCGGEDPDRELRVRSIDREEAILSSLLIAAPNHRRYARSAACWNQFLTYSAI
ncbi:hypothetical protein LINGRAHAP2_LOCUS21559 [Linum grandiflorum]